MSDRRWPEVGGWSQSCAVAAVARPSAAYEPRRPEGGVVYQVVRDHFETFCRTAGGSADGEGLPGFVTHAFRALLRCGWLAGGFARFRCAACGFDRLVAFSCKDRTLCPSCGARRMVERAAHLVDAVLPDVPVRQWVLTVPTRLRYQLAWNHGLCRMVTGVLFRAITRVLRERAPDVGVDGGRSGGVVVIQRFGSALNLNVHFHALVLDGVFAGDERGALAFHEMRGLTALDVAEVLAIVEPLVISRLRRLGLADGDHGAEVDAWTEEAPLLAGLAAASVQGLAALGARRGAPSRRVRGSAPESLIEPRCHARMNGFDLHADLVIGAGQRERLERVCRYVLRAPVTAERLQRTTDDRVVVSLRRAWRDGTTAIVLSPLELIERLAVLVPRPRVNLLSYHGVLGARSAWRAEVTGRFVPGPVMSGDRRPAEEETVDARDPPMSSARGRR